MPAVLFTNTYTSKIFIEVDYAAFYQKFLFICHNGKDIYGRRDTAMIFPTIYCHEQSQRRFSRLTHTLRMTNVSVPLLMVMRREVEQSSISIKVDNTKKDTQDCSSYII
jgi:hypothetical protein